MFFNPLADFFVEDFENINRLDKCLLKKHQDKRLASKRRFEVLTFGLYELNALMRISEVDSYVWMIEEGFESVQPHHELATNDLVAPSATGNILQKPRVGSVVVSFHL